MTDYNAILKRIDIIESGCPFYRDTKNCTDCPSENKQFCWLKKLTQAKADINGILKLLDDWAAAHPVKTYAQDIQQKFPNGDMFHDEEWKDNTCLRRYYGHDASPCNGLNCSDCWNRPMPDAQQDC